MTTKNIILASTLFTSAFFITSCNQNLNQPAKERTIEVSGIAEKEVEPDEVYFTLTVQEYKKGGKKISLDAMEKYLIRRAHSIGIKKEDLKLDNLTAYSYNYYYYGYSYKRRDDIYATGNYRIKLKSTVQMDKLLDKNDSINVTYAYLSSFSTSKKEQYNDELREKALKITRDKAIKLLAAVGEEVGQVVAITDEGNSKTGGTYYPYGYYYGGAEERSANYSSLNATASASEPGVSPRNIKLRAEMKVVYKIK